MSQDPIQTARELYNVAHWGAGYFGINAEGHACVHPTADAADGAIDLVELTAALAEHDLALPVLVRFDGILRHRVDALGAAFAAAADASGHRSRYTVVYPIKVNQQHAVVEAITSHGGDRVGLEAGSKPELMAVLAATEAGGTIVCNGYKDREYLRLALIGRSMGHRVFVVVEKPGELELLLEESARLGIPPLVGMRVRLASVGAGKWQNTGGSKGKFGLTAGEALAASQRLHDAGHAEALQLLHVHLGSQIANLRDISNGLAEASRFYVEMAERGHPMGVMDVGGGLGVDYEGTRSRSFCSMNYGLQDYADAVVRTVGDSCHAAGLDMPDLITESGRALTAHHAVLITDVISTERTDESAPEAPDADAPAPLPELWALHQRCEEAPVLECHQEAEFLAGEAQHAFVAGRIGIAQRAQAERLHTAISLKVLRRLRADRRAHHELLDELGERLADRLFCNMSVFQSLPDVWAFNQIFPIMPLGGLERAAGRRALIKDLTCDSDGRIDNYVDNDGIERSLPMRAHLGDGPELIGFFMVGAYQETLGDIHNLFGDTDSVDAELDADGGFHLLNPCKGETADQLLRSVGHDPDALRAQYQRKLDAGDLSAERRAEYLAMLEHGLTGYTYLED